MDKFLVKVRYDEKYKNIKESSCLDKMCTACQLDNSLQERSKLTLRGLCRYSFFDTIYTVHYSPDSDSIISYVGVKRTVISYNSRERRWTMRDVTSPHVSAVSDAPYRSLAIGNINWTVTNDSACHEGVRKIRIDNMNKNTRSL